MRARARYIDRALSITDASIDRSTSPWHTHACMAPAIARLCARTRKCTCTCLHAYVCVHARARRAHVHANTQSSITRERVRTRIRLRTRARALPAVCTAIASCARALDLTPAAGGVFEIDLGSAGLTCLTCAMGPHPKHQSGPRVIVSVAEASRTCLLPQVSITGQQWSSVMDLHQGKPGFPGNATLCTLSAQANHLHGRTSLHCATCANLKAEASVGVTHEAACGKWA